MSVLISCDFSEHCSDPAPAHTVVWPWIQWAGFLLQGMEEELQLLLGLPGVRVTPQNKCTQHNPELLLCCSQGRHTVITGYLPKLIGKP